MHERTETDLQMMNTVLKQKQYTVKPSARSGEISISLPRVYRGTVSSTRTDLSGTSVDGSPFFFSIQIPGRPYEYMPY